MQRAVLIIDDEAVLAKNIRTYLKRHGFEARVAESGAQGLAELEAFKPGVVLLDYQLGDLDGLTVLSRIRALDAEVKVIMMTGHGSVDVAVSAMKAGACDYLTKPLVLEELRLLLDKVSGQQRLEGALAYYQGKEAERSGLAKLLGESPPMLELKAKLQRFIAAEQRLDKEETPPAVLITGATGTGKELVARAFHFDGRRRAKPFVEVNCASIPAHLVEAELFGFERGAFTDAKERKPGLVEAADGGTLFLDEIGELDLALQAKLLRLLEEKTVRRLGSVRDQRVDVRIIAATNQHLEEQVQRGRFRSDLWYRLRVIQVELPPLHSRGDDVLLLADAFLRFHAKRYGKDELRLSPAAQALLRRHTWPGNVRELRNLIEQAVLLAEGSTIEPAHLAIQLAPAASFEQPQEINLEQLELRAITQALQQTQWNITRAAQLLGISRDTLRYRMEKHGLRSPAA